MQHVVLLCPELNLPFRRHFRDAIAESTRAVLDACPGVKYVGIMATGVNNVDLIAAREKGVRVTNIPGYSTAAVAQLAMANILQFAENLAAYNESTARGDWQKAPAFTYFPYPIMELSGKNLGIHRELTDLSHGQFPSEIAALIRKTPDGDDIRMYTRGCLPAAAADTARYLMPVQTDGGRGEFPGLAQCLLPRGGGENVGMPDRRRTGEAGLFHCLCLLP